MVVLLCVSKKGNTTPPERRNDVPHSGLQAPQDAGPRWREDPSRSVGSFARSRRREAFCWIRHCVKDAVRGGLRTAPMSTTHSLARDFHRLRDMANEWPILVRVTT